MFYPLYSFFFFDKPEKMFGQAVFHETENQQISESCAHSAAQRS